MKQDPKYVDTKRTQKRSIHSVFVANSPTSSCFRIRRPELTQSRGKFVLLYGFVSYCTSCHTHVPNQAYQPTSQPARGCPSIQCGLWTGGRFLFSFVVAWKKHCNVISEKHLPILARIQIGTAAWDDGCCVCYDVRSCSARCDSRCTLWVNRTVNTKRLWRWRLPSPWRAEIR